MESRLFSRSAISAEMVDADWLLALGVVSPLSAAVGDKGRPPAMRILALIAPEVGLDQIHPYCPTVVHRTIAGC